MADELIVQMVISQLKATASRAEFVALHQQTAEWMQAHPDCVAYEVYEGKDGAIADRIVWRSREGARRGNEDYARSPLAADMQGIIERYTNFFGSAVRFEPAPQRSGG